MTVASSLQSSPLLHWRIRRGTAFYALSLLATSAGYYIYWWIWKLKAYYFGWATCLAIVLLLYLGGHLRLKGLARDILPVATWFLYLLASALWSPSPYDTLYFMSVGALNFAAYIVGYAWYQSTSVGALSGYFELQTLLIIPLMLYFLVTIGELFDSSLGAVRTGFATTCLTSLPFLIWRARARPSVRSVFVLVFALIYVVIGESRSALLIAPVLIVGSIMFVGREHRNRRRPIVLLLSVCAAVALAVLAVPSLQDALARSYERFRSNGTSFAISSSILDELSGASNQLADIERRLQLFVALRSFVAHPLLGAGFESTYTIIHSEFGREVSAHGLPSTLLGETGLVGTTLFVWMIVRFYRRVRVAIRRARSQTERDFLATCKVAMLGFLLLGMFHQVDQNLALYLLMAWGSAAARAPAGSGAPVPDPRHAAGFIPATPPDSADAIVQAL